MAEKSHLTFYMSVLFVILGFLAAGVLLVMGNIAHTAKDIEHAKSYTTYATVIQFVMIIPIIIVCIDLFRHGICKPEK